MPSHHPTMRIAEGRPACPGTRDFGRLRLRSVPTGRSQLTAERSGAPRPLLLIWLRGGGILRQHGRTVSAAAGSLCFLPNDAPVWLRDVGGGGAVVLELPGEIEIRSRQRVAAAFGIVISTETGAAAFLRSFLDTLVHQPSSYSPDYPGWVQTCARDIIERVLAEELGSQPTPSERAVLAAKGYVATHLTDPDLTPDRVARAASVSLRTLNRLFAADGDSICGWIRRHRLEGCRDDLLDPGMAGNSISQIGALWGFLDAAHFSRTFKDAFGCSPRAYRAAASAADHRGGGLADRAA